MPIPIFFPTGSQRVRWRNCCRTPGHTRKSTERRIRIPTPRRRALSASGRAAGLDVSLVLPIATSPKPSPTLNDFAAQVNRLPGLRSFGSVHPRNPAFRQELERVRLLGLRGIKLHPEYQGFFVDDPEGIAVVRAAADLGLWVVFHAGADIGMPPPIHCTPERVIRLRKAVPEAKIILAHLGGFLLWGEVLPVLKEMDVWLDTSYSLQYREPHPLFAQIIPAKQYPVRAV